MGLSPTPTSPIVIKPSGRKVPLSSNSQTVGVEFVSNVSDKNTLAGQGVMPWLNCTAMSKSAKSVTADQAKYAGVVEWPDRRCCDDLVFLLAALAFGITRAIRILCLWASNSNISFVCCQAILHDGA